MQASGRTRQGSNPVVPFVHSTHPVEYGCPPLHGDALEDGEHGVDDVVEGGDAVVGAAPLLQADGALGVARVRPRHHVRVARHGLPALQHHRVCNVTSC